MSHEQEAAQWTAELIASRRVIVETYEVERYRIERNLRDSAQRYLVVVVMKVGEAQPSPAAESDPIAAQLLAEANTTIQGGLGAPHRMIRGIHPQLLRQQSLPVVLKEVAAAAANRVRIVAPQPLPELPEGALAVGYFFTCETIGDAAKYAPRADATVLLTTDRNLRVSVVDRGPGGARIVSRHGLAGIGERLAAASNELTISSPPGGLAQLAATIPLLLDQSESAVTIP